MNFKKFIFIIIYSIIFIGATSAVENKILFKVNNEIITSLDIFNELKYLKIINEQFKDTEKKQAFEIAKRSLIRGKIKEIELKRILKEIKIEDQFLNNVLINYFKNYQIKSISDFENYFLSMDIDPNSIKKKISIEVLWNEFIFNKYKKNIKINKADIIDNLEKNTNQKEFFLSEILFNVNENENLEEKYDLIKDKIQKTNFSKTALMYSISETASKGGELGWIKEISINKKIKDSLQKIGIGDHSNPILIPGGFLILKIEDIRETDSNYDLNDEVEKVMKEKTNEQLNQFSNIYFNKIQKNITINEL